MKEKWWVYIVLCRDQTLYTGVTTNLKRRIEEHNNSPKGATYTKSRRPVILCYSEPCTKRGTALTREWEIKKMKRKEKLALYTRGSK